MSGCASPLKCLAVFVLMTGWLSLTLVGFASAQDKIGLVDIQRVMQESKEGKKALAKLQESAKRLQNELNSRAQALQRSEQNLRKMQAELRQKSLLFSEDVRRQKEDELLQKQREFARGREGLVRFRREAEDDFNRERVRSTQKIRREIRDVVVRIGKSDKFTLVLERNNFLLYFDSQRIDLTDRIIKAYDQAKQ